MSCRLALLAAALLGAFGCSSSSSTSVTGPSSGRCTATLTATPSPVPAGGGAGQVTIAIERECTWTARADGAWLSVTSATSGQGPATVSFTAETNSQASARTGAIVVNEQRAELTQSAASCTFSLSEARAEVSAVSGSRSIGVAAVAGCQWTAASQAPWITVGEGASGSGDGRVTLQIAANTATAARTGTVTIAGQPYTVAQAGATAAPTPPTPGCTFSVQPNTVDVGADAASRTVAVSASAATCEWTVASNVGWIAVASAASGRGGGTVTLGIAANSGTAGRSGVVSIGGSAVTVNQSAPAAAPPPPPTPPSCSFSLSSAAQSIGAAGGDREVNVIATDGSCTWTATSTAPWITVVRGASGTGSGAVGFQVAANTATTARTGAVQIAGQTVTVSQDAAQQPCTYSIAPAADTVGATGGDRDLQVVASDGSCTWTAASNAPWLTILEGTSGSGPGRVRYRAAANTATASRQGTLTIAGQAVPVTQAAADPPPPPPANCTFTVAPVTQAAPAAGGTFSLRVTASLATCSWAASATASWIRLATGTGAGTADVSYAVDANSGTTARTGTINVAGRSVTVNQAAASPLTVSGTIAGLSGACPSLSFSVGGRPVQTSGLTVFSGGGCGSYRDGRGVSILGLPQANGGLLAITSTRTSPD